MESPHNKMIGSDDVRKKGLSKSEQRRIAISKEEPIRDNTAEDSGPQRFFFPSLGVTIQADSQEEANEKAEAIISERNK